MELYINYLHRELTETENAGRRTRTVVNDRQRIYDDYTFRITFAPADAPDYEGNDAETLKQVIRNSIIDIYRSHASDRIGNLAHPSEGNERANCIAFRFDDEDANYGETVFLQQGSGWKYYSFPPFGMIHGNSNRIDPRTVIDGLLSKDGIKEIIRFFEISYQDITWHFENPSGENSVYSSEKLIITDRSGQAPEEYVIENPSFVFPYPHTREENEINIHCASYTTKFAILTKGKYHAEGQDIELFFQPKKQYCARDEIRYILSGKLDLVTWQMTDVWGNGEETEGTEWYEFFTGDFCSNDVKTNHSYMPAEFKICSFLGIYPVNVFSLERDCNFPPENLYCIYSDVEKLSEPETGAEKFFYGRFGDVEDDYEAIAAEQGRAQRNAERDAREMAFRTNRDVKRFEQEIFDNLHIKSSHLEYYEMDENGYENWTLKYRTEKTGITVYFSAEKYQLNGIFAKRVEFENLFAGRKKEGKKEDSSNADNENKDSNNNKSDSAFFCDLDVDPDNSIILVRSLYVGENFEDSALKESFEARIRSFETIQEVMTYYEETLFEALLRRLSESGIPEKKTSGDHSSAGESPEESAGNAFIARKEKAGQAGAESLYAEETRNPKLASLYFYLSSDKNTTLSYSENTINEIAECVMEWIPIMDAAKKEGISVRKYLENEMGSTDFHTPPVRNIAIMGEAGTGKTTLAKKLAESCLGADFSMVLGSELKGAYVAWSRVVIAQKLFSLQSGTKKEQPAVLFIDEAYTIFEQSISGEKGTSEVIELLLKLAEPEEYPIELKEISDKDLRKLGLIFKTDFPELYDDEDLYDRNGNEITVKKVLKKKNTVIWLGGYEDRLRKSFAANEGLNRRFDLKIIIPSPKMDELMKLFKEKIRSLGTLSGKSEKEIRNFLLLRRIPTVAFPLWQFMRSVMQS